MRSVAEQQWLTRDAESTQAVGSCMGRQAQRGDFIACCGTLGSGKTTFVQGFAQGVAVGAEAYVRSPTFALVHEYHGRIPIYHFDFYRLLSYYELLDIGFDDYCAAHGVVIVEWADKFPELLPARRLDVYLQVVATESRAIRCVVYDQSYRRYLRDSASSLELL